MGPTTWCCGSVLCSSCRSPFACSILRTSTRRKNGTPAESQTSHNTVWKWLGRCCLASYWLPFSRKFDRFIDQRKAPEGSKEVNVNAFMWGVDMDYAMGSPSRAARGARPADKANHAVKQSAASLFVSSFPSQTRHCPGRYNELWFEPTVASEMVTPEELAQALKTPKRTTATFLIRNATNTRSTGIGILPLLCGVLRPRSLADEVLCGGAQNRRGF